PTSIGNGADQPPKILVLPGLRHEAADAGIAALHAAAVPLYQRDQSLVRVAMVPAKTADGEITCTPGIVEIGHAYLARTLGRVAHWQQYGKGKKLVRTDPPKAIVGSREPLFMPEAVEKRDRRWAARCVWGPWRSRRG